MTPTRETVIDGNLVEEFWWAGERCVYVNNSLQQTTESFDDVCNRLVKQLEPRDEQ